MAMAERDKRPLEERYKYVPLPGGKGDSLDQLEFMAKSSGIRISVSEPEGVQPQVFEKYGNEEKLQKIFEDSFGLIDEQKRLQLEQKVSDLAKEIGSRFVKSRVFVLDNKGENGSVRAYSWPYIGVEGELVDGDYITTYVSKEAEVELKNICNNYGVEPGRVTKIETNPGVVTARGARAVVFIGKA